MVNNTGKDQNDQSAIDQRSEQDQDRIDAYAASQLKTSQTLLTIAVIAGPVSLILGGVLLSVIALVCAIVAYAKIKKVMEMPTSSKALSGSLRRQSLICIAACSAALVINTAFFVQMMSLYMDYVTSGDLQGLMDAIYGTDASSASSDLSAAESSGADADGSNSSSDANSSSSSNKGSGGSSVWDK